MVFGCVILVIWFVMLIGLLNQLLVWLIVILEVMLVCSWGKLLLVLMILISFSMVFSNGVGLGQINMIVLLIVLMNYIGGVVRLCVRLVSCLVRCFSFLVDIILFSWVKLIRLVKVMVICCVFGSGLLVVYFLVLMVFVFIMCCSCMNSMFWIIGFSSGMIWFISVCDFFVMFNLVVFGCIMVFSVVQCMVLVVCDKFLVSICMISMIWLGFSFSLMNCCVCVVVLLLVCMCIIVLGLFILVRLIVCCICCSSLRLMLQFLLIFFVDMQVLLLLMRWWVVSSNGGLVV